MHGPNDTHVPCADCGTDLAFCNCYKREEVLAKPQYCHDCFWKRYEKELVEDMHTDCGRENCPMKGEFHEHTVIARPTEGQSQRYQKAT